MNKDFLLDAPSDKLLFGFDKIKQSIVNFLDEREPRYTIGIFGEWGSGKTTILESIYEEIEKRLDSLSKNKDKYIDTLCIPVWFNPWRYEHEEHMVIPLLLQIRQTLSKVLEDFPHLIKDKENFGEKWNKIVRALIYGFSGKLSLGIAELSFSAKDSIDSRQELHSRKDSPREELEDIQSIYFNIIGQLEKLTHIGSQKDRVDIKYFIFIDDLDRCFPDKALKLLEHIKILFDLEGFVFIMGLDTRSIKAWIKRKYGVDSFISGKDYVEKLIQIPVVLPKVKPEEFIESFIKQENLLEKDEIKVLYDLKDFLPQNPRSLKRIVNDYLLIRAAYKDVDANGMFKMLILKHRWERCYNDIMRFGEEIFTEIVRFVKENKYERDRILFSLRNKNYPSGFSFNEFKEELDEQTEFESRFSYFGYFKDYVFDVPFIKYIKDNFKVEEIGKVLQKHPSTGMLNYVEDFQSRWR